MHVCADGIPNQKISDERAHLCAGHAYALVIYIERGDLAHWLNSWIRPINNRILSTFLNSARCIAEGHREQLLAWRANNPTVGRQ